MTREQAEKLFDYLCKAHPPFGKDVEGRDEVRSLWLDGFEATSTYDRGFDAVNAMLAGKGMSARARQDGRAGWPSLPGYGEALAVTNPPPEPRDPVSVAEMEEASAMKGGWNALDDATKDEYRQRTMHLWGLTPPLVGFNVKAVDGHARVTWWLEAGKHAKPTEPLPF